MKKTRIPEKKKRVSKEDWLNASLDALLSGGIDEVRVERLAAQLGVSRSGFYYHFRDRADLEASILAHWLALDKTPILDVDAAGDVAPVVLLSIVAESVEKKNLSKYDAAIRHWSKRDANVRRVWQREMKRRTQFIREIFRAAGFEGDDLEVRMRLFVAYQVGEHDLFSKLSVAERRRHREIRLKLLLE